MKLFVAKLNREVTDAHLKELFSQFGVVEYARVITDRDTGESKCFGFVTLDSAEAGRQAIATLNGEEYMRFRMVVKEAEERPGGGRSPRPGQGGGRPSDRSPSRPSVSDAPRGGLRSERANDPGEFSRVTEPGANKTPSRGGGGKGPAKRGKSDGRAKGRDIYQDGPAKPAKAKRSKPKNQDWLDDLDFE